ncbi:MAG: condensation domain-containing protein, partial [Burkholderiaceae bacterium]
MQDIGIHHDFFELGGHSLLATKIVARIRSEFSVQLSLQQFFENSTIERLAVVIEHANASYVENPIRILDQRDKVPLSFAQQRLWFLDRYEENSNFYHMPSVLKIAGDLDIDALNRAFVTLIERHEILRTNFISDQGQGFQKIHPTIDWSMDVIELDGETNEERESQFSAYIDAQLKTAFSLESDALLRVSLYKMTEGEYRLFINMHHIIADGWSITVLINEITALYSAFVNKVSAALKDLPVQYADYSVSQIEYLQGPVLTQQSIYWSKKLKDLTTISLPLDFERPRNQTYNGDRTSFAIDKATVVALDELSNQQGVTLFMTLLSAFNVLLGKYSGDTDISIGTPIANRVRAEIEPLIGFFANTLTLRSDLDGDPTFAGLLQQVKNTTLEAYSNQDIPFEKVVDLVLPERDSSRSPLFQVSFSFQQNPPARSFTLPGITIDNVTLENKTAKFDLLLEFMTTPDGLSGSFEYNTDLFKRETIEGFVSSLSNLINAVISDPQRKLSGLSLIADARIEPVAIALDAYPILRALYGNAIAPEGRAARYYLLDDMANLVPHGVVGKLYFDLQSDPDTLTVLSGRIVEVNLMGQPKKLLSSGFTARHTSNGLALLSSVDDVALINNQLIYPRVIEQQLLTRPDVQDCHVAIRRHAELGEQIVVYLVCQDDAPDANDFTQYLQSAGFADINVFACVKVGTIPLTRHGEVNARELHKYAVHNQATRQLWAEKVSQLDKVDEVVVASQVNNAQQAVSHLLDLLPIEARGSSSNIVSVVSKAKKVSNESISTAPAVIISESIVDMIHRPNLLSDMIVNTAQSHADKAIEFYHADNSTGSMSYAELLLKAQCVLGGLQATGLKVGSKVIFQFDRNEDFIVSFWACQLGGFIPVPIAAAKNYRTSNAQTVKVAHAWKLMDNAIVLTGAAIHDGVCNIAKLESIDDVQNVYSNADISDA